MWISKEKYNRLVNGNEDLKYEIERLQDECKEHIKQLQKFIFDQNTIYLDDNWEMEFYKKCEVNGSSCHIWIREYWYPYCNGKKDLHCTLFASVKDNWDQIIERIQERRKELNNVFDKAIDVIEAEKKKETMGYKIPVRGVTQEMIDKGEAILVK